MPKIYIKNIDKVIVCNENEVLLNVLRKHRIQVQAVCGGLGLCGLCRVLVTKGNVSEPTDAEKKVLGGLVQEGWRLACQTRVLGDIEVIIPKVRKYILENYRIRTKYNKRPLAEVVEVKYIKNDLSCLDYLLKELGERNISAEKVSLLALSKLPEIFYKKKKAAVLVDRESHEVLDLINESEVYGIAVDLGTTTVVAGLVDLSNCKLLKTASTYNKQLSFGNNIISRISYAIKGEKELREVSKAALDTIEELIDELAGNKRDRIFEVVVAGNTAMTLLFLGISPHTLGFKPFTPPFTGMLTIKARELGFNLNKEAIVRTLPVVGGYIGGDVIGDILVSGMLEDKTAILVDIGTNGEIVLKKNNELYSTSVPAGPSFEGVGLTSGMLATYGAVHRVFSTKRGIQYVVIGGGKPKGICGSGYIDLLAELIRHGILNRKGRLLENYSSVRRRSGVLEYVLDYEENVVLSQKDIRKLQLAIAAFKVGYKILLSKAGISPDKVEKIYVAGSFGFHVNPVNAIEIGLLPKADPSQIEFIGNGSLGGAILYLTSSEARKLCKDVFRKIKVIEAPMEKEFQKLFLSNLTLEPVA